MPGVFEKYGLHFQYPDNWSVEQAASCDEALDALPVDQRWPEEPGDALGPGEQFAQPGGAEQGGHVIVSSPHTAFWHLSRRPGGVALEPLFDEALSALRTEYERIEVEPASDNVEGFTLTGYNVSFFCMDLISTCWLRGFAARGTTYLLMCQAEDREFVEVCPVFRAMLASVLRNIS